MSSTMETRETAGLTPRQREVWMLIRSMTFDHGCAPTMQELADVMNVRKVTIFEFIEAMERKGFVVRDHRVPRSLVAVHPDDGKRGSRITVEIARLVSRSRTLHQQTVPVATLAKMLRDTAA